MISFEIYFTVKKGYTQPYYFNTCYIPFFLVLKYLHLNPIHGTTKVFFNKLSYFEFTCFYSTQKSKMKKLI